MWRSDAFHSETDPNSIKGRNLRSNPAAVVQIQDGLYTVIAEGRATLETDSSVLSGLVWGCFRKYDYMPDWSENRARMVFRVQPWVVHAWHVPRMGTNLVNFIFREEASHRKARTS